MSTVERVWKYGVCVIILVGGLLSLAACRATGAGPATEASPTGEEAAGSPAPSSSVETATPPPEPVILDIHLGATPATIDPALVAPLDASGNDLVANLFAGLAYLDPDTGEVEPSLAERWEVADDGRTWTVFLRDDVYWVQLNPESGEIERVRPVTAGDVVYAVQRVCREDTGAPQARAAFVIEGCRYLRSQDPALLSPEIVEQTLGVRVLNDVAVEFRLESEAAYFPTILAMPVLTPVPAELVEAEGEGWTQPDVIWTSGPYTVQPTIPPEEGYTLIANLFWPLERSGNVDVVQISFEAPPVSADQAFAAWQAGDLALTVLPGAALADVAFDDDPSYWLLAQPAASLIVFSYDTPPFNNAAVRRAFSLAIDRQAVVDEVLKPAGQIGLPAFAIAPPGSAGAPRYGEVGAGYDPETARTVLAEEGFSNCASIPPTTLLTDESDLSFELATRYVTMWQDVLGCREGLFTIEQAPLRDVLVALREPPVGLEPRRPALIMLFWEGDYPDTYHWLADIFGCRERFPEAYLNQARPCIEADEQLAGAAHLEDEVERAARYAAVEEAFFGPEGEMPLIPVYYFARPVAVQPWLEIAPLHAGAFRFDRWVVDGSLRP